MNRRLPLVLLAALTTLASPSVSSAACSSGLPVNDRRAANHTCTGVHPGMGLIVPSQKYGELQCSAGYAFTDQFRQRYLTVPGTCFLDYDCLEDAVYDELPPPLNEVVPRLPTCLLPTDSELEPYYKRSGPPIRDLARKRIGALVYAVNKDGVDFALVRLDPGVRLDPAVPMYGGPLTYGAAPMLPTESYVYAPAPYYPVPNAVSGLLHGGAEFPRLATELVGTITRGAPVMKPDGTAIGMLDGYLTIDGYIVRPLGPAVDRASRRTRLKLRLMTAKLTK